jgi:putative ABC transport system permease protein
MTLATVLSGASQGILWAILTVGVYLTFRILDVADLTVEGSFPLGAAVCVTLINRGVNPFLATLIAVLCGALAGLVTGVLITGFKIPPILSGILTMIALYSVNIRIMNDRATVHIEADSVKTWFASLFPAGTKSNVLSLTAGVLTCALIVTALYLFFGTELGCAIRATGSNKVMARAMGVNTELNVILGLMLSNALIALSGSMIAQFDYGSSLVNMGQGTIVIGLASVIIGEVLFIHRPHNFAYKLCAVIVGAVIYRTIIACALTLPWLKATDLKLITAVIVAIALALPVFKSKGAAVKNRRANKEAA